MKFVVLSSSRGTTFQAVIESMESGALTAQCVGLVTDRADRGCIAKAEAADIPVQIVEKKTDESRDEYDRRVHEAVQSFGEVDVLAAMGWMFVFGSQFIEQWDHRILNVHPALLPKYGGKGMYGSRVHEAVLAAKEAETGISIHWIDTGVDTGPIIVQKKCSIEPGDTPVSLQERVQNLEKEWYPKVLQMIETGEVPLS